MSVHIKGTVTVLEAYHKAAERCLQDEPGLKSKDSGMSSVDGESNSDNEDQSLGDPAGPPGKRRMRKIPKLPMVRHGKKWYRARLLKDSGQGRVQIGNTCCLPKPLICQSSINAALHV